MVGKFESMALVLNEVKELSNCWRMLLRESYIKVGSTAYASASLVIIWCSAFVGETKPKRINVKIQEFLPHYRGLCVTPDYKMPFSSKTSCTMSSLPIP